MNEGVEMDCPKCGFANAVGLDSCVRCGVIFAKLRREPQTGVPGEDPPLPEATSALARISSQLLLGPDEEVPAAHVGMRALVLAGLAVWGMGLALSGIASNAAGNSVLHLVNLPFHEAGHIFFRLFGRFFTSLGGTLMQLLVPLLCLAVLLLKTRDAFGASVCAWWFGENFLDIAPYINDARAGTMPAPVRCRWSAATSATSRRTGSTTGSTSSPKPACCARTIPLRCWPRHVERSSWYWP